MGAQMAAGSGQTSKMERRGAKRIPVSGSRTVRCKPLFRYSLVSDFRVLDASAGGVGLEPYRLRSYENALIDRGLIFLRERDRILLHFLPESSSAPLEAEGEVCYVKGGPVGSKPRVGIRISKPPSQWGALLKTLRSELPARE